MKLAVKREINKAVIGTRNKKKNKEIKSRK